MFLLGGRAGALKNLKVDESERHQTQSEAGHDTGEEYEEARNASVNEPPGVSELDVLRIHDERTLCGGVNSQGNS